MSRTETLSKGDTVRLVSLPTGCTSRHYKLTLDKDYLLKDFAGSCVITTTDDPHEDGMYWRGRVEKNPTP